MALSSGPKSLEPSFFRSSWHCTASSRNACRERARGLVSGFRPRAQAVLLLQLRRPRWNIAAARGIRRNRKQCARDTVCGRRRKAESAGPNASEYAARACGNGHAPSQLARPRAACCGMPAQWGPFQAPAGPPPRLARPTVTRAPRAARRRRPAAGRRPRLTRSNSWTPGHPQRPARHPTCPPAVDGGDRRRRPMPRRPRLGRMRSRRP
jgi:hypothetical protein